MISVGDLITATARDARQTGAVTRRTVTVMGLLVFGEIARLRDAATLAGPAARNREVLPVAQAADLPVRQKGSVQLTTASIVVDLDMEPNSVGIRMIKARIRSHRSGRVAMTVQAPVMKDPQRGSELDLQVPGQGGETGAGQICPTSGAVGPTKIRVTPRENAEAAPRVRRPPPRVPERQMRHHHMQWQQNGRRARCSPVVQ